ncbi:MAG: hypothetical protein KDB02_16155, partial [Acidimicrobiales bacterium]|nr:hypothetical protein [Acidimicrobiales bacterium]
SLNGSLLPEGATVGQVLRAEVETSLDGTEVTAVLAPKEKNRRAEERIELITRTIRDDELVMQTLAPKRGRGGRDRDGGDRRRRDRRDGDRRERSGGPRGDREGRDGRRDRNDGPRGDRERSGRGDRQGAPRRERPAPPPKPKAKRLRAGRTHRKAALSALPPEEQVIAEQVLRGGIPAVRQAVDRMNEQAKVEGRPTVKPDALIAVAEKLLPTLRAAEWRDRAEAAAADIDELDLRDLRSVVVAADQGAKDDETRELAAQLREGLTRRVDQEQQKWLDELAQNLTEGRVVRALRLSSRPPKAGNPIPPDLTARLTAAASAALTSDTFPDRWATVLDALSYSPVRLTVVPESKPDSPSDELVAVITRVAGRVPKVAEAFGITSNTDDAKKRGRRPAPPAPAPSSPAAPTEEPAEKAEPVAVGDSEDSSVTDATS